MNSLGFVLNKCAPQPRIDIHWEFYKLTIVFIFKVM